MADVYSKKQNLPIYGEPHPSAQVVAELKFSEKVSLISKQGRWLNVKTASGKTGWVYSGNVGDRRPPEENKADLMAPSSGVDTAAAARGLSDTAKEYASRHGEENAVNDLIWMDKANAAVTPAQVTRFMKENELGEYAS